MDEENYTPAENAGFTPNPGASNFIQLPEQIIDMRPQGLVPPSAQAEFIEPKARRNSFLESGVSADIASGGPVLAPEPEGYVNPVSKAIQSVVGPSEGEQLQETNAVAPAEPEQPQIPIILANQQAVGGEPYSPFRPETRAAEKRVLEQEKGIAGEVADQQSKALEELANARFLGGVKAQKYAIDYENQIKEQNAAIEQNRKDREQYIKQSQNPIDSGRWAKNLGNDQRVMLIIGAALGGFAGGPNAALDYIQKSIDRDIDGQKSQIDSAKWAANQKTNALNELMMQGKDALQARNLLEASHWRDVQHQLQSIADQSESDTVKLRAKQQINAIDAKLVSIMQRDDMMAADARAKMLESGAMSAAGPGGKVENTELIVNLPGGKFAKANDMDSKKLLQKSAVFHQEEQKILKNVIEARSKIQWDKPLDNQQYYRRLQDYNNQFAKLEEQRKGQGVLRDPEWDRFLDAIDFTRVFARPGGDQQIAKMVSYGQDLFNDEAKLLAPFSVSPSYEQGPGGLVPVFRYNLQTNLAPAFPTAQPNAQPLSGVIIPSGVMERVTGGEESKKKDSATLGPQSKRGVAENQKSAYNTAIQEGLSPMAANALVANLTGESIGNPSDNHWDSSHMSQGIAQWDPQRSAAIKKQFGKEPKDMSVEDQTRAAIWEMRTRFPTTWNAMQGNNPQTMMSALVKDYERPANQEAEIVKRMQHYSNLVAPVGPRRVARR